VRSCPLRLSAALRSRGVETTLLVGDATTQGLELCARHGFAATAYRVSDLAARCTLQWTLAPEFAAWLGPHLADADLVHAHMVGAWWAAAQAMPPAVPLVASEHNALSWPCGDHTDQAASAAKRVDMFFAHGPAAWSWARGIGLETRLRPGRSSVTGLLAEPLPGLPSPRITFAGRFREDKGPDVLIEALALLAESPPAYLVGDGPLRDALRQQAAARGLDQVTRFPGWSYRPDRYIAGSSVHVVPSRAEAWSQSAVQGLGLGVPVVGTKVDGLACTLADGRGILVPPDDPGALAAAMSRVLGGDRPDPGPGRAYAREFTPSAMAELYLDSYRTLLDGSRPRPAQ
jgi:glycosyltransferase involved in cell wall biosynthesis